MPCTIFTQLRWAVPTLLMVSLLDVCKAQRLSFQTFLSALTSCSAESSRRIGDWAKKGQEWVDRHLNSHVPGLRLLHFLSEAKSRLPLKIPCSRDCFHELPIFFYHVLYCIALLPESPPKWTTNITFLVLGKVHFGRNKNHKNIHSSFLLQIIFLFLVLILSFIDLRKSTKYPPRG